MDKLLNFGPMKLLLKIPFVTKLLKIQLIRYAIIGGMATIIDWGLFYLLAIIIGIYYQISVSVSFIVGATTKFVFNKILTFQDKSKKVHIQYPLYVVISLIALGFSLLIMYFFVDMLQINKMLGRIITTIIVLFINYVLDKHITFNKNFFKSTK